ncbi:hypothetical protein B0H63DRAFT_444279 [Podospora didyma]|uniref:DUF7704 domain-containing protein n=1 Tax=Podospora didyma TaxID=330526 RepID=A0AAE0P694_9PEZI|nr:hypothetical protein B0H63DRAFT_444279 [Podospora didyma]
MASQLPAFPRFVFTIFEPISLLAGAAPAIASPDWFFAEQIASPVIPSDHTRVVTRQLGNCYGLAFLVAIAVLYSTTETKVVRNYLIALWVADIGHVAITCLAMGGKRSFAFGDWNPVTWGNIGITVSPPHGRFDVTSPL